jgi:type I restriction enzyme R subunit
VKAYEHFNDPEWDGEPAEPEPPAPKPDGGNDGGPADGGPDDGDDTDPQRPQKVKIKLADGKERTLQHMTATAFWSPDGRPMSAAEFVARLFGDLPALFKDEDELRKLWSQPDTRSALLDGLAEKGYGRAQLREIERMIDAENSDLYDVLAYIAFALAPLTRQQRADASKPFISVQYEPKLQAFLNFVLAQYVKEGVGELDRTNLPHLLELKYRAINDAAVELGGVASIRDAFIGFQRSLYC